MLKIGDFSRLSRVTVKALRYYDEIGLLKPAMVDRFNGYRYYSVDQLPRLNRIVVLKNLGLSLEEIAQLTSDNLSAAHIRQLLQVKQAEIRQRLSDENQRLGQVEEWLKQIEKEGIMPAKDVIIKKVEAQTIASVRGVIPTYGDIGQLYEELYSYLGQKQAQFAGPCLAIYHDMEYMEKNPDVEAAASIAATVPETDRVKVRQLEAIETAASLIHEGPYDSLNESYQALMAWADSNGYRIAGPDREVYLKGFGETQNPAEFVTELQLPVVKK